MDFKLYESRSFSLIAWFSVKFLGRFKRRKRLRRDHLRPMSEGFQGACFLRTHLIDGFIHLGGKYECDPGCSGRRRRVAR